MKLARIFLGALPDYLLYATLQGKKEYRQEHKDRNETRQITKTSHRHRFISSKVS
jgi:hypothetical protein